MSATLTILAVPKASRSEIAGWQEGALKVRVAAPPVDGQANEELSRTLAQHLGVPKRAVSVVSGQSSRRKRVAIEGISPEQLVAMLPEA